MDLDQGGVWNARWLSGDHASTRMLFLHNIYIWKEAIVILTLSKTARKTCGF